MTSTELENLARIGKLKREPPAEIEIDGLLRSAEERLKDSARAFALAALRRAGYRSDTRYLVFQTLPHTTGMAAEKWRILAKAHERRNLAEYEGHLEQDERLLAEVIGVATELKERVASAGKGSRP